MPVTYGASLLLQSSQSSTSVKRKGRPDSFPSRWKVPSTPAKALDSWTANVRAFGCLGGGTAGLLTQGGHPPRSPGNSGPESCVRTQPSLGGPAEVGPRAQECVSGMSPARGGGRAAALPQNACFSPVGALRRALSSGREGLAPGGVVSMLWAPRSSSRQWDPVAVMTP